MWTEAIPSQYGESRVVSHGTGYEAVLNFKPYSFLSGNVADVEGKVLNKAGEPVLYIRGNWNRDAAIATHADGPWRVRRGVVLGLPAAGCACAGPGP